MKLKLEIDVSDDFEPCTFECIDECPFVYEEFDAENPRECVHCYQTEHGNFVCPVSLHMIKNVKTIKKNQT